jgi:hypothetical protein
MYCILLKVVNVLYIVDVCGRLILYCILWKVDHVLYIVEG